MDIINRGERINSMVLDQIIMAGLSFLFFLPFSIVSLASSLAAKHEPELMNTAGPILFNLGLSGVILYFCKDVVNGRSWGKRRSGLQVVNYSTGEAASPMRCFVRNLTAFIFYIEFIVTLANPERRIGDYLAGTKVIRYDASTIPPKVNRYHLTLTVLMACSFLIFFFPCDIINWKNKVHLGASVVPESLNDRAGRDLETFLLDSIGYKYTADIRVYDQLKENKDIQYISALITKKGENEGIPDSVAVKEIDKIGSLIDLKYSNTTWRRLIFVNFKGTSIHGGGDGQYYSGFEWDDRWYRLWYLKPSECEGSCS